MCFRCFPVDLWGQELLWALPEQREMFQLLLSDGYFLAWDKYPLMHEQIIMQLKAQGKLPEEFWSYIFCMVQYSNPHILTLFPFLNSDLCLHNVT